MRVLKQTLLLALFLVIGIAVGLLIGGLIAVAFTDTTFAGFIEKLCDITVLDMAGPILFGVACFIISFILLIVIHEAGHLVCGIASGYSFVSFRILSCTFIRLAGKLRIKRFSIAGTGGQCLLCPPSKPIEQIPVTLYNLGGILANLLVLAIAVPLWFMADNEWTKMSLTILCAVDLFLLIMNGVPMKLNGLGNDAWNTFLLRNNIEARRGLVMQLRANALIQNGVRPKDMPDEIFIFPADIDYGNALEIAIPIMAASRLIDRERFAEAYDSFSHIYRHKDQMIGLYAKECACELAFLSMIEGHFDEAAELLDKDLMRYINMYRSTMSSKERILCAIRLYIENDREGALNIYHNLEKNADGYLLQGEVLSDLAIMKTMLKQ